MKIIVERFDATAQPGELVVLVGDPYQRFVGNLDDDLEEKFAQYSEGFAAGALKREVSFSLMCKASDELRDFLYFHSSTEKGFTAVENLKTFVSRALRLAADTGRQRVGVNLRGPDGDGLIEQLTEGAVVGTFAFSEFLKDKTDRFANMELVLYMPIPIVESGTSEALADAPTEIEPSDEQVVEVSESLAEETSAEAEVSASVADLESAEAGAETATTPDDPFAPEAVAAKEAKTEGTETSSEDTETQAESSESEAEPEPEIDDSPEDAAPEVKTSEPSEEEIDAWRARDESAVLVGQTFGDGVNLARALIARPASVCTPAYLAKSGEEIAKRHGFAYQAFGPTELKKHGFVGHVAVGGGSANPPRMFEMTYEPATPSDTHLVLVGKGVTFDSGGISIKGADKMHLMVGDMSGAAAVLGTMEILGRLKPTIKVTAIVVSAENAPDGKSFRPGDILKYKNGVSVHVENTDAEGRLLLADGLIRAGELGATHVIDIATLTGSCVRALGSSFTGVMGANRKMVNAVTRAGGNHGESYWRLPLPVEYKALLKTIHADLNNIGGPDAGATTAGLFLQEFVPARTPWVHLDIAGTFWKMKPWKYYQEGPSGTGVKTLADLALRWHEHFS